MSEGLLTLAEAAELLRCSTRTLRRRVDRAELPVFRDGRIVRVREIDLAGYVARRTLRPPEQSQRPPRVGAHRTVSDPGGRLFDDPDPLR